MEIGPVTGVRAVSLLAVHKAESVEPPVFEIDPSARAGDETYSFRNRPSIRGIEGEDSATPEEEDHELAARPILAKPNGGVSYFA